MGFVCILRLSVFLRRAIDAGCIARVSILLRNGKCNGGGSCRGVGRDLQVSRLDEEVPHATRLVDVDLDQFARLPPAEFPASPRVLAHEGFLDDKIGLGKNA